MAKKHLQMKHFDGHALALVNVLPGDVPIQGIL